MKHYILILITVYSVSCKNNKSNIADTLNHYGKDTGIYQTIWWGNGKEGIGKYFLQTYILTHPQQSHLSDSSNYRVYMVQYGYAPYNKTIAGNFEFIKHNKIHEYEKASEYYTEIKKEEARQRILHFKDSVIAKMHKDTLDYLVNYGITSTKYDSTSDDFFFKKK